MAAERRGSIAFFTTYRPPLPLDIFSCPIPTISMDDEVRMTDEGNSDNYNYNAQVIPPAALKTILKRPIFVSESKGIYNESDVDSGRLSGMVFVSERGDKQLETLHIAIRFNGDTSTTPKVDVFSLADVFGTSAFNGVRMEDSGCFAGDYLIYVSTKEPALDRRQPWTAVYKTNLKTGETERVTPRGIADLSPSVSPSGKMIAVASFQEKVGGWDGEIEDLQTNIFVMNVDKPFRRKMVLKNGGWPTWGSDKIIFFHRRVGNHWGVFRANISKSLASRTTLIVSDTTRVTPEEIDAMTPAAISSSIVAVATFRQKSQYNDVRTEAQYRHIEIFHSSGRNESIKITQKTGPTADHFNPFVISGQGRNRRIGYHRCKSELVKSGDGIPRKFDKLDSPDSDVALFRVPGAFPTFSRDGSKLAFVDNEFKAVWVADSKGLRIVYQSKAGSFFSPVWNQNPNVDILYVCIGPSFNSRQRVDICAIKNTSGSGREQRLTLTKDFNNAFPSTNPEGTKLVFRSTRDGGDKRYKNLYIMDAQVGEYGGGELKRLTTGDWTDTQCQWSPRGDWIIFSSTRDKPPGAPELDNGLDPGYFAVFLVKWNDSDVVVRVIGSRNDLAGHVNYPFFSPDGKSIVVTADLAAVSVDPISLPIFLHSVRPYGDIFTIDIDPDNINNNKDVSKFNRITHSRYENATASWIRFSAQDPNAAWNLLL